MANHEAVDLAKWFIGDKPRLLSASERSWDETKGKSKEEKFQWLKEEEDTADKEKAERNKKKALSKKQIRGVISGSPGSYHVKSEEGKNLGGPYKSREQAKNRLEQVEYFKHKGAAWTEEPGEEKEEEGKERRVRRQELSVKGVRKQALLDKGMGIFQPAMYRGREVLLLAIDNTGNGATVEDSNKQQFQVDVADLTPTKTGPYTGKPRG